MSDYSFSTTDPAATVSLTTAYAAAQMTGYSLEGIDIPSNCYLFRLEGSLTTLGRTECWLVPQLLEGIF